MAGFGYLVTVDSRAHVTVFLALVLPFSLPCRNLFLDAPFLTREPLW